MLKCRLADTREYLKIITANGFVTAYGPQTMSTPAQDLLFIALAQIGQCDTTLYEYRISVPQFAKATGRQRDYIYDIADRIVDECLTTRFYASYKEAKNKEIDGFPLYSRIRYNNGNFIFKLNLELADYVLNQMAGYVQTKLGDILKMKSQYAISMYRLIQARLLPRSQPPKNKAIRGYLSVDDIRAATGTLDRYERINNLHKKVIIPALKDIEQHGHIMVDMKPKLSGHRIVGYNVTLRVMEEGYIVILN